MNMNKRQKCQVVLAAFFAALFIFWLIMPGWVVSKILGLISSVLGFTAMFLSYRAEERLKKDGNQ